MRFTGVLLVIVGVIALTFGGIRYQREHAAMGFDGMRTALPQGRYPLSRTFGGFVILGGLVLLVVPRQRLA